MEGERKKLGKWGEELACQFLKDKGWRILATNYRVPVGEIDILAQDKKTIVIVEVKTKANMDYGLAKEKVDRRKQDKLRLLANWISTEYHGRDLRIDVIGIDFASSQPQIEYLANAVEA